MGAAPSMPTATRLRRFGVSRDDRGPRRFSQRALQVEAAVRRLFGRDRRVGCQQAPSEHVVAGAVDGLHADKLPGPVAERRERARGTIATHHHAVIAGGQSHHCRLRDPDRLQNQAASYAGFAGQPGRDATRVVGGVLHRLQPQRAAEPRACIQRTIADRRDIRIGGQQCSSTTIPAATGKPASAASSTLGGHRRRPRSGRP